MKVISLNTNWSDGARSRSQEEQGQKQKTEGAGKEAGKWREK